MKIHVETRSLANYVQILSSLIGQIISVLIGQWRESGINVNLICVDKFHVKSCFRTVYVLIVTNMKNAQRQRINLPIFNLENIYYCPSCSGGPISILHSFTSS